MFGNKDSIKLICPKQRALHLGHFSLGYFNLFRISVFEIRVFVEPGLVGLPAPGREHGVSLDLVS